MSPEEAMRHARSEQAVAAFRAIAVSAEDLLGRAQRQAPKKEGTLRGSGRVVFIVNDREYDQFTEALNAVRALALIGQLRIVDAQVSFNTVYAARQHEEITWHHDVGKAKYLEDPLKEMIPRYEAVVAAAVGAAV